MKKTLFLLFAVFFISLHVPAQPPKTPVKKGSQFGEKITAANAISPDSIAPLLTTAAEAEVKIKGKVASVCEHRGCFIYIKTAAGKMYIKTKDDSFFVPLALKGKTVVVKGTAAVDPESKEIAIQATGILVL